MGTEIRVPPLGESVSEATIAKITKKLGENVKVDELIIELETDKVTLEVNAPANGIMEEIIVKEGDVVKVGQILGKLNEKANAVSNSSDRTSVNTQVSAPQSQSLKNDNADQKNTLNSVISAPSARKMMAENDISENSVQGTGKDGRIMKGDVIDKINNNVSVSHEQNFSEQKTVESVKNEERVKLTRLRKVIAQRLKDSQNTAAILTTFNEVDMTAIMAIRAKYKDIFEKKHKIKLGFMSFFVKAAIVALKEIPNVNAEMTEDEIIFKNHYDIGVAVGTEQGLVVPVLRDADKKSFSNIEQEIVNYGKKARDGKLTVQDMTGGTFTISNGGVYGSLMSTPIINPPQSAILGMHKTMDRPVAIAGKVEIRPMMYLALSYDHRIIDGKEAVTFLVRVKECLENPERLLFDL